ncbi:unnamed protein product [Parajaminaea phylloscopi]
MSDLPVYTIFGATGLQGSAVAQAIAEQLGPRAHLRAITRTPSSPKSLRLAETLRSHGTHVELVEHDLSNHSPQGLRDVLDGTAYLFLNTNSFELGDDETRIACEVIDAAADAGPCLRLLVWSTLPSAAQISHDRYTGVKHFEQKAAVDSYLGAESSLPWVGVQLGWFAENIADYGLLHPEPDGSVTFKYAIAHADTAVAWTWVRRELGPAVVALFESAERLPPALLGHSVPVCGFRPAFADVVAEFQRQTGKTHRYERLAGWGNLELDEMNRFFVDFGLYSEWTLPVPALTALGAHTPTLAEFVADYLEPREHRPD